MDVQVAHSEPWQPERARLAMRGRVLVRLRAGEDHEHIPALHDVRLGVVQPHARLDAGGRLDQVLRRRADGPVGITRLHTAAGNRGAVGLGHLGWDDLEVAIGLSRTFRIDLNPEASLLSVVGDLGELDVVESVSPNYLCEAPFTTPVTASDEYAEDYGHRLIGAAEALSIESGDETVIVGVVDSGARPNHPELGGRLRPGLDTVDLPSDYVSRGMVLFGDTNLRDRDPDDEIGHGTTCAAIIAGIGKRLPVGVAGASRVLPIRALAGARFSDRESSTAVGGISDIDEAVKAAVDLGASVINMSFGTPESALREGDPVPHIDVVRYALARGCILVAASGNSGDARRYFPAALPGVLACGSVGPSCTPSQFTTRGDHVALSAPGERLYTASLDGYARHSGTSFAAPFVAAACALLVSRGLRASTRLDAPTIRGLLTRSARSFSAGSDSTGCGAGVLDIPSALRAADELLQLQRSP